MNNKKRERERKLKSISIPTEKLRTAATMPSQLPCFLNIGDWLLNHLQDGNVARMR